MVQPRQMGVRNKVRAKNLKCTTLGVNNPFSSSGETMALTGKQNRYLRAMGHHLAPVVTIGKSGLSDEILAKLMDELESHELIKVKVGKGAIKRNDAGPLLAEHTGAHVVQLLGKTILLYRARKEKPGIRLP